MEMLNYGQDLLTTIDKFFVQRKSRILALSLLCEFFRHQPPHLHQMLQTPLFDDLLRCLQIDTSTRAISLAMTALVMFLPHIPKSSSQHLPALFNIYSRMLFWDKERRLVEPPAQKGGDNEDDKDSEKEASRPEKGKWEKLAQLLESDDEIVPELLHYFTFLYGLYPINFMSYIRKPQRYLRHAKFPGADDLDIDPIDIQQRSEPFRQVHLMHPNFFKLTIESELTDKNRWQRSAAPDVVAECMALYVPSEDGYEHVPRPRGPVKKAEPNADIPDQPLLDSEPISNVPSRVTSWRDVRPAAVLSPEDYRSSSGLSLRRKISQTSQSMPSIADSPTLPPSEYPDSPTIMPQRIGSPANQLSDILHSQISTRRSLDHAFTNDSVTSLHAYGSNDPSHVNNFLDSLTRETIPRSPSLRPSTGTTGLKVAYLHREIQLLKNDLNFERYLKQQHLSHIGRIRRQQIREARVEAETQHLMNYNRGLKAKLTEAKRVNAQMRKETDKSKAHARKWEADLTAKLRVLREAQKKWTREREKLIDDLAISRDTNSKLEILIIETERRATEADQTVKSVKSNLDELERLRKDVDVMSKKIVKLEVGERDGERAQERAEAALNRVHLLELELGARDSELAKARAAFEAELENFRNRDDTSSSSRSEDSEKAKLSHVFLDTAMAASRHRIKELQSSHSYLLKRYTRLQAAYADLREELNDVQGGDEPLLGGSHSFGPSSPSGRGNRIRRSDSDHPTIFETSPGSSMQTRPGRLDTTNRHSPAEGKRPVSASGSGYHFQAPQPYGPPSMEETGRSADSMSGESAAAGGLLKITSQSDIRVFGRGKPMSWYDACTQLTEQALFHIKAKRTATRERKKPRSLPPKRRRKRKVQRNPPPNLGPRRRRSMWGSEASEGSEITDRVSFLQRDSFGVRSINAVWSSKSALMPDVCTWRVWMAVHYMMLIGCGKTGYCHIDVRPATRFNGRVDRCNDGLVSASFDVMCDTSSRYFKLVNIQLDSGRTSDHVKAGTKTTLIRPHIGG